MKRWCTHSNRKHNLWGAILNEKRIYSRKLPKSHKTKIISLTLTIKRKSKEIVYSLKATTVQSSVTIIEQTTFWMNKKIELDDTKVNNIRKIYSLARGKHRT